MISGLHYISVNFIEGTRTIVRQHKLSVCLAIVFTISSCQDMGFQVPEEGGVGIIVPGKSIEGISLGESKEDVEQQLGEPSAKGWTFGVYRGWRFFQYREGLHAGLSIEFIDYGPSYGPVDLLSALSPYSGKTKEGIGLGSALIFVRQTYGIPRNTLSKPERNWIADFYCFDGKKLEIHYLDSIVTTISTGYFIPIDEDTLTSCR